MVELTRSEFPLPHSARLRQLAPRTTAHDLSYAGTSSIRGSDAISEGKYRYIRKVNIDITDISEKVFDTSILKFFKNFK